MTGINRLNRVNRINRFSSLRSSRIKQSYVDRLSNSQAVNKVEPLDPVSPIDNPTGHSSENHLLSYESYYNNVKDLKQEFKSFYHNSTELTAAISQVEANPTKLLENTNRLIKRYNQTVATLTTLDQEIAAGVLTKLRLIMEKYSPRLTSIGVQQLNQDCVLHLDEKVFLNKLTNDPAPYRNLFLPLKRIITDLYATLLSIKTQDKLVNKYQQFPDSNLGQLIDKKS